MLKSGADHLRHLRDGRSVYIGQQLVRDVTAHPAFRNGAQSIAAIYDLKAAGTASSNSAPPAGRRGRSAASTSPRPAGTIASMPTPTAIS